MNKIATLQRLGLVSLLTLAAIGALAAQASAVTYQVTQLTDDSTDNYEPKISGNNVVWRAGNGSSAELYFYDGTTTTQITNNSYEDNYYDISGDKVTWLGWDGNDWEVFLYDGSTSITTQLSNNSDYDGAPAISGDNVVWASNDSPTQYNDVMLYDGNTTSVIASDNNHYHIGPAISGDNVAYHYEIYLSSDTGVALYDGNSTTQINDLGQNQRYGHDVKISGDKAVWTNGYLSSDTFEIVYYDGVSSTWLTNNGEKDSDAEIAGDYVTWVRNEYPTFPFEVNDDEIFLYDGVTTTKLTDNDAIRDENPDVSAGGSVVWQSTVDGFNSDYEIMVYDGATTTQLTDNSLDELSPQIDEDTDTIVWYGDDGNDFEIFMATPNLCLFGDADGDGDVDIDDILPAFTNFTGPGSFCKTRAEGDVEGDPSNNPCHDGVCPEGDGDVDISDIITMFGAFTGPLDEAGGLAAAAAGDPAIPDLVYDADTGEVVFDLDGAAGLIGYSLKSAGGLLPGGHTPILGGVTTSLTTELAEAALSTPGLPASIGFVFPLGMDLAALSAFLTDNTVSTGLGAPLVPFDLVVVGGAVVPEPATIAMALFGLVGLGLVARRRRR